MTENLLTSAEMTAFWRSQDPELSGDHFSSLLVSHEGVELANNFKESVYPLIEHHLALRNRFFFTRASKLLKTGEYDVCVSIGSGLSLLTHYLAEVIPDILFYDMDLPEVVKMRAERLLKVTNKFNASTWRRIQQQPIDLETSFIENTRLKELLPRCTTPLIFIEGVIFYLSEGCFAWLLSEFSKFKTGALIFDYWPAGISEKSSTTKRMLHFLNISVREQVKMFHSQSDVRKLAAPKKVREDSTIQEVEAEFVKSPLLMDNNLIVPCHYAVIV